MHAISPRSLLLILSLLLGACSISVENAPVQADASDDAAVSDAIPVETVAVTRRGGAGAGAAGSRSGQVARATNQGADVEARQQLPACAAIGRAKDGQ